MVDNTIENPWDKAESNDIRNMARDPSNVLRLLYGILCIPYSLSKIAAAASPKLETMITVIEIFQA